MGQLSFEEWVPENSDEYEYAEWGPYEPKYWDEDEQMWMDAETGLPWCDHVWVRTYSAFSYNASICDKCGERNY